MLLIIGTVRLPPSRLAEARPAMFAMVTASRAEAGCLDYSYAVDVLDSGLVHVQERWTDRAALAAHFASDHLARWRESWDDLGIGDRNLSLYEVGSAEET